MGIAAALGHSGFDDRDRYDVFGWEADPDEDEYLGLYLRNPYARAVVDRPATATWRHAPDVVDDAESDEATEFETTVEKLQRSHDVDSYAERADRLAGIGEYGLLFIDFDDTEELEDLEGAYDPEDATLDSIRGFRVYAQAQIDDIDYGDFGDDRWGRPKYYHVDLTEDIDDDADEDGYAKIHHSRVVAVPSTQLLDDEDKARPRLEPVLNPLYDIEKTLGAVAEAAYSSANSDIWLNQNPDQVDPTDNDNLRDEFMRFYHQGQPFLRTVGSDVEQLSGEVQDPSGLIDTELSAIAAQTGIPKRILSGDAAGELSASQEDTRRWYARIRERQQQYAAPLLFRPLIDMLREYGILPEPAGGTYEIGWPELYEPTEQEIAERQQARSETARNLSQVAPGFSGDTAIDYIETGEFPEEETTAELEDMDEDDPDVSAQFRRQYLPDAVGNATRYTEGDQVMTPQGIGVVAEVRTEPFEGKNGEIEASDSSPVYVVGLKDERVGVGFYTASELEADEIETDVEDPVGDVRANACVGRDDVTANDWSMPESWRESDTPARLILLDAWSSMGGQFDCGGGCCMGELKSRRLCASMKDEVLGGWEGWRR